MQITINSANIGIFQTVVKFNLYTRQITFDTSGTTYFGGGAANVQGICFQLIDQDGIVLLDINWTTPQLHPAISQVYTYDASALNFAFLFQTYSIVAAIKDQDGTVYSTPVVYKKVCQPVGFNDSGYVPGIFQVSPDCVNNSITVKELTSLTYNNLQPTTTTKTGVFSYPTGTIAAVNFSGTPFSNNVVYTGQYRIACTTVGEYNLGDDVYVDVSYITNNVFDVTCANKMADLMCCIIDLQNKYLRNCDNSIGAAAKQQLDSIAIPLMAGLIKEINGQDASFESELIKKTLNCNCGATSIGQNEVTPINPSVYSIVINGVGGTTVPSATIIGSTKTYNIASNIYQVVKGDTGDLAYTITIDTSTPYTVKYKLTFNYAILAETILNTIADNSTLTNLLNSIITNSSEIDLSGLDGKCVINLSLVDYALTQTVHSGDIISNIVINGTVYNAPALLDATDQTSIQSWLTSLSLGNFTVSVVTVPNGGTTFSLTILSLQNDNVVSTLSFSTPSLTVKFGSTTKTLQQILQAIINYLCSITTLQIGLYQNLSLCLFDYNGNIIQYKYTTNDSQAGYNLGISQAICNIVSRIDTLTGITCDKLKAIFQDNPNGSFGANDRVFGTLGGNCAGITDKQVAALVIAAVGKYSDIKTAWCAIDCTTPGTCPDVTGINAAALSNTSIGFYGVNWTINPASSQSVIVKYRVTGSSTWIVANSSLLILPNGNLSGSSPYVIGGLVAGDTYDISVANLCGGAGFITQVTVPTSTVFSASYLRDTVIYNICGGVPVTLYTNVPFAPGVTVYTNVGLTIPLTGYTLIAPVSSGHIYAINSSTGVVGADTGSVCSSGTAGTYILGNSSGTICSGSPVTLYTSGAFVVGGTLYTDSALTTPQTGFSFVVNTSNNHIYNLNSGTGVIGSDTGLTCSVNFTVNAAFNFAIASVTGTGVPSIPNTPSGSSNSGFQTGISGNVAVVLTGAIVTTTKIVLNINGVDTQCLAVTGPGTKTFTGVSTTSSDTVIISVESGTC